MIERGPVSRLLEKVEPKKYVGKRFDGEGPLEKICGRRAAEKGLRKMGRQIMSVEEGLQEKIRPRRFMR